MPTDPAPGEPNHSPSAGHGPTWRVWLLVGVWALLLAQGVVDGISRAADHNIYPTVAMPGFSAKNVRSDGVARITKQKVELIGADGELRTVDADQLLAPLNSPSAVATLDRIFDPQAANPPELSPEVISWLRQQSRRTQLGVNAVGVRIEWQPVFLDIEKASTTPAGQPTVREVRW